MSKNQTEYERVLKLNEQLKQELIRTKENLNYYKSNFSNAASDINKLENVLERIVPEIVRDVIVIKSLIGRHKHKCVCI